MLNFELFKQVKKNHTGGFCPGVILLGGDLVLEPRSGGKGSQVEHKTTRLAKVGDRAFSNYATLLWNQQSSHIKASPSVQTFKKNLKTHVFWKAFH